MKKLKEQRKNIGRWIAFEISVVIFVAMLLAIGVYTLLSLIDVIKTDNYSALGILVSILVACNLGGMIIANLIVKRYTAPLNEAIEAIHRLSKGDYSVELDSSKDRDKIKQLKEAINKTATELANTEILRKDFIDTASHEYKTPVSSILGYAGMLKDTELTEEQRQYVEIISEEAGHLASMTSSVLLLDRIENMEIVSGKESFSLDEQLRTCFQMLQHEWMGKDISISGEFNDVTYYGNEELLNHVWLNIIKNAIKYTDRGGDIYCSVREEGANAVVTIKDNGEGMDTETQKRIFDKFYQKDSSRHLEGNGLGLSIAKRAVDLCGGRIEVESTPDQGSAFTVILPNEHVSEVNAANA